VQTGNIGAVVILSGGLDSATAAAMAQAGSVSVPSGATIAPVTSVAAVSFDYGQRHSKELGSALLIAQTMNIRYFRFILPRIVPSHLTRPSGDLETSLSEYESVLPSSWHPHRNAMMITAAAQLASSLGVNTVIGGWHQEDVAYPDCTEEFLMSMERMLRISGADPDFMVVAPLLEMTKVEIVQTAVRFRVPIELTWSCYEGGDAQCGKCGTCKQRKKAFREAGVMDPVPYADSTVYDD